MSVVWTIAAFAAFGPLSLGIEPLCECVCAQNFIPLCAQPGQGLGRGDVSYYCPEKYFIIPANDCEALEGKPCKGYFPEAISDVPEDGILEECRRD